VITLWSFIRIWIRKLLKSKK